MFLFRPAAAQHEASAASLRVMATWQRDGDVRNLIAGHVEDLTALLGGLATSSRDFH